MQELSENHGPMMYFIEDNRYYYEKTEFLPERTVLTNEYFDLKGLDLIGHSLLRTAPEGVPLHYHLSNLEITIITKGSDFFTINNEDFVLYGGDVLIVPPNTPHKSSYPHEGLHEQVWFQLDLNAPNFLNLSNECALELCQKLKNLKVASFPVGNNLTSLAKRTFQSFLQNKAPIYQNGLFLSLLVQILDYYDSPIKPEDKIQNIKNYIRANYNKNITVETLCKEFSVSRSWLHHNFNNQTPIDYLNYVRITKAKELLKTDMSLTDIAFNVGFSSSSYFSTIFKKYVNISPSNYRRYNKK